MGQINVMHALEYGARMRLERFKEDAEKHMGIPV